MTSEITMSSIHRARIDRGAVIIAELNDRFGLNLGPEHRVNRQAITEDIANPLAIGGFRVQNRHLGIARDEAEPLGFDPASTSTPTSTS